MVFMYGYFAFVFCDLAEKKVNKKPHIEAITKQPKLFYHEGGEMFNLYLSKGDKRTTKRILLRNVASEDRPIVERVFKANGWQVTIERMGE